MRTALMLMVVASAATLQLAAANFADAAGFSGRGGATCVACHTPAPDPLGGLEPQAQAVLEGLPQSWEAGQSYPLTVRVTGGPAAMPAPQPQGGFNLAVGAGRLVLADEDGQRLRLVGEAGQEATYRPAGTLQREWHLSWMAPGLEAEPAAVPVWLAVLAANGNHVIASNVSDGGERLDAAASLQQVVPPSELVRAAWRSLPLLAPAATATLNGSRVVVEGRHVDGNATRLLWSLDDQPWQARDTAPAWRLNLPNDPGEHRLRLRSEGAGRASPDAEVRFGQPTFLDGITGGDRATPNSVLVPLAALAAALLSRRSPP